MSDPNPPVLEYARPRQASWGVLDTFVSALAFAAGHWVAEYATGYVIVVMLRMSVYGKSPREQFEFDMTIETFFAFCEFFVVLVAQLPGNAVFSGERLRRRTAWPAALVLGIVYCWLRWGIWGLGRILGTEYPFLIDWLIAMTLSAMASLLISRWRWPRT